ncbi:MAG: hypothetical protein JO220_16415 [Hyphomicrobiales bacterium]|nr:hypothetical protein [Hyphomicrobiales bacterium]
MSLDAALAALLALALLGAPTLTKIDRPPLSLVGALLACLLVAGAELVDFRFGATLYQPTLALDMVKHAATVNSIVSWGLPLTNPFVTRAEPGGYYYFFYTVAAMPVRLTMGVVDARAAVGALAIWDGAALLTLAVLLWQKSMPELPVSRNIVWALVALLLCGNLDIIANVVVGVMAKAWPVQIEWWNQQVSPWVFSLLWVPHHLLALIAGIFGLILISERPGPGPAIVAAIAFASCVGASVWVGLAIALAALFWLASLIMRRQYRMALALAAAGCLAAVLLIPQIYDILQGRADKEVPIAFYIRPFPALNVWVPPGLTANMLHLILLPVNYLFEFGIFLVGAILFWRHHRSAAGTEAARILMFSAASGLLLATFTRSTLIYNDLGWRAVLPTQLAFLIWTCAVILTYSGKFRIAECFKWPGAMGALLLIGYAGIAYQLVIVRAYPVLAPNLIFAPRPIVHPELDDALASAYSWANTHVPRDAVLQHNPASDQRVFGFGLYGRNRVAVADRDATLYGASRAEVDARRAALAPIFTTPLSAGDVRARALTHGIDVLVVSSTDPAWSDRHEWVWSTPALFASPHVRLIATRDIAPKS